MIQYTSGNLLNSRADALVCPVNCVGVMGKGLALAFKQRFPTLEQHYKQLCRSETLRPGRVVLLRCLDGHNILLFPTEVVILIKREDDQERAVERARRYVEKQLGRFDGDFDIVSARVQHVIPSKPGSVKSERPKWITDRVRFRQGHAS